MTIYLFFHEKGPTNAFIFYAQLHLAVTRGTNKLIILQSPRNELYQYLSQHCKIAELIIKPMEFQTPCTHAHSQLYVITVSNLINQIFFLMYNFSINLVINISGTNSRCKLNKLIIRALVKATGLLCYIN